MKNTLYKIEFFMLFIIILLIFVTNNVYRNLIAIIASGILLFTTLLLYGNKKDNDFSKWSALRIIIAVLLFYFIVVMLLGLRLGFSRTLFSLNIKNWFKGLIPICILTIIIEYLRFILVRKNIAHKKAIYFLTGLIILFNIIININFSTLNNTHDVYIFICTIVLPIIANDIFGTYLVYNHGLLPSVVYRLIINLYVYLVPITTELGDYLYSIVHLSIPLILYIVLKKYLNVKNNKDKNIKNVRKINISFITIPLTIAVSLIIILVSGVFKYQMIAIASNSMAPIYFKGDAIIFEKTDGENVKIGDIIVFNYNQQIVAHRVVKIKINSDSKYFYTKGDANMANDPNYCTSDQILGVVKFVAKYVGYPTVWVHELFGGEIYEN